MKNAVDSFKPENLIPADIPSTWQAMEKLYDSGKARAIGVSNFSTKKLGDLLEIARVPPAVNQVECHPTCQRTELKELCKSRGVHLSVSSLTKSTFQICTNVLVTFSGANSCTDAYVRLFQLFNMFISLGLFTARFSRFCIA